MNIYFSCSITGGRRDQVVYQRIAEHLTALGHDVPTAHLSRADVLDEEKVIEPLEVYNRDVRWVEECDALVAEVSTPSHGVGYEIALALSLGKPVFCCYREGIKVSKILLGNTQAHLKIYGYADEIDLLATIDRFLADLLPL
ncbi:MAG: nucleoside 2-deoxyribosyltransferase [Anaerolineaceae bacterium]|jgi:nucleoside 2-deoxyribosyltransferase|nr:nucleoside 2-deoxyribosyltransferase [Anaerolineaceae bacterium]